MTVPIFEKAIDNMKSHDPKSPLLLGRLSKDDVIHNAKQESWRDMQLKLQV